MIHYLKIKNFGPVKDYAEINFEVAENMEEDAYEITMPDGRKLLLEPTDNKAGELQFDPFLFREKPYEFESYIEFSRSL